MKNLSTALFTKFTGSAFSTSVGGRLHKGRAPQTPTWPYAVFYIISDSPRDTFTDRLEEVLIQFSIFSMVGGSTEIEDIFTNLTALYDDCALTITSGTHLMMERQNATLTSGEITTPTGTEEYWQYDVDYSIVFKRN